MKTTSFLSLALVASALCVSGCGGSDSSSGSGGSGGGGGAGSSFDARSIVTADDATAIFGNTAAKETGTANTDPNFLGECLWGFDNGDYSQLMEFRGFDGQSYYSAPTDSDPVSIGDQGYVRVNAIAGVEVAWLQGNWAISLSYGTAGTTAPDPAGKVDEMKALAQKAAQAIHPQ